MDRLGNHRYGYHLLVPNEWDRDVNSTIRPTQLEITANKVDAGILVLVMEDAKAPDVDEYVESRTRHKDTESFTLIRSWRTPFNDMTGYIVNFSWKGKMLFGTRECGKTGVEYQASVAMVNRNPSPIMLVCYSPKKDFKRLFQEYFGDARASLMVEPVELTVREAPEG